MQLSPSRSSSQYSTWRSRKRDPMSVHHNLAERLRVVLGHQNQGTRGPTTTEAYVQDSLSASQRYLRSGVLEPVLDTHIGNNANSHNTSNNTSHGRHDPHGAAVVGHATPTRQRAGSSSARSGLAASSVISPALGRRIREQLLQEHATAPGSSQGIEASPTQIRVHIPLRSHLRSPQPGASSNNGGNRPLSVSELETTPGRQPGSVYRGSRVLDNFDDDEEDDLDESQYPLKRRGHKPSQPDSVYSSPREQSLSSSIAELRSRVGFLTRALRGQRLEQEQGRKQRKHHKGSSSNHSSSRRSHKYDETDSASDSSEGSYSSSATESQEDGSSSEDYDHEDIPRLSRRAAREREMEEAVDKILAITQRVSTLRSPNASIGQPVSSSSSSLSKPRSESRSHSRSSRSRRRHEGISSRDVVKSVERLARELERSRSRSRSRSAVAPAAPTNQGSNGSGFDADSNTDSLRRRLLPGLMEVSEPETQTDQPPRRLAPAPVQTVESRQDPLPTPQSSHVTSSQRNPSQLNRYSLATRSPEGAEASAEAAANARVSVDASLRRVQALEGRLVNAEVRVSELETELERAGRDLQSAIAREKLLDEKLAKANEKIEELTLDNQQIKQEKSRIVQALKSVDPAKIAEFASQEGSDQADLSLTEAKRLQKEKASIERASVELQRKSEQLVQKDLDLQRKEAELAKTAMMLESQAQQLQTQRDEFQQHVELERAKLDELFNSGAKSTELIITASKQLNGSLFEQLKVHGEDRFLSPLEGHLKQMRASLGLSENPSAPSNKADETLQEFAVMASLVKTIFVVSEEEIASAKSKQSEVVSELSSEWQAEKAKLLEENAPLQAKLNEQDTSLQTILAQHSDLTKANVALTSALNELRAERDKLLEINAQLVEGRADEAQLLERISENARLTEDNSQLAKTVEELRMQQAGLVQTNIQLSAANQELEQQVRELKTSSQDLLSLNTELSSALEAERKVADALRESVATLQRQLEETSQRSSCQHEAELTTKMAEIESKWAEIHTALDALASERADLDTARSEITLAQTAIAVDRAELSRGRSELEAAREELEAKSREVQTAPLGSSYVEGHEALEAKKAELESLQAALAAQLQELEVKQAAIAEQQRELDAARAVTASQASSLDSKRAELDAKLEELQSKENELKAFKIQLEDMEQEILSQRTELSVKQLQLEKRQTELDKQQADLDAKEVDLDDKFNNLSSKQVEIIARQSELDSKQADLDAKQVAIDARQSELDARQAEMDNKQIQLLSLEADLFRKQMELDEALAKPDEATPSKVTEAVSSPQDSGNEKDAVIAELRAQLEQMENKFRDLQAEFEVGRTNIASQDTTLDPATVEELALKASRIAELEELLRALSQDFETQSKTLSQFREENTRLLDRLSELESQQTDPQLRPSSSAILDSQPEDLDVSSISSLNEGMSPEFFRQYRRDSKAMLGLEEFSPLQASDPVINLDGGIDPSLDTTTEYPQDNATLPQLPEATVAAEKDALANISDIEELRRRATYYHAKCQKLANAMKLAKSTITLAKETLLEVQKDVRAHQEEVKQRELASQRTEKEAARTIDELVAYCVELQKERRALRSQLEALEV